jgi:signal transduction histidine kinase
VEVSLRQSLVTPSELPESLFRYVIRTQESVILDDASVRNQFSEDEYVRQKRPKSVLCLPLVKQGKLMGALYLENNLAPSVFTPKRMAMLELLASQAAISLDHARVYAELARENSERKRAEEELRRSEALLAQGQRISHTGSWGWQVATGAIYWSEEHFRIFEFDPETDKPSYSLFMERIHSEDRASFEELLSRAVRDKSDFENQYRVVLPDGSIKFLRTVGQAFVNPAGELEFIGTVMDVTDLTRAEEMQVAIAREREMFAQQRATQFARANEALRGCLDTLASVPALDDFLGQVTAAITGQLGAVSSTLRLCNVQRNVLSLEFVFQDGRVMSPAEARYPKAWQSWALDDRRFDCCFDQPVTVQRVGDPQATIPEDKRAYLLALGVKTVLVIPLISRGQAVGRLTFRFTDERDFSPEELEIARALATQASLAIQLTRLANTARQSAVLEERNRLAGEIHDALAQSFTAISMQLEVAQEEMAANEGDPLRYIRQANVTAKYGLAEARRSVLNLRSSVLRETGFVTSLQRLVEHSNLAGRLRCDFRSDRIPEESLPGTVQHQLLRIAQEAISNAVRHAKPTVVSVTLHWDSSNLILQVKDNGSGITKHRLEQSEGVGLESMRERAAQIDAKLEIQTAAGQGTTIIVTVPVSS